MAFGEFFRSGGETQGSAAEQDTSAEHLENQKRFGAEVNDVVKRDVERTKQKIAELQQKKSEVLAAKKGNKRLQKKRAKQVGEIDLQLDQYQRELTKQMETLARYGEKVEPVKPAESVASTLRAEYGLNEEGSEDVERKAEEVQGGAIIDEKASGQSAPAETVKEDVQVAATETATSGVDETTKEDVPVAVADAATNVADETAKAESQAAPTDGNAEAEAQAVAAEAKAEESQQDETVVEAKAEESQEGATAEEEPKLQQENIYKVIAQMERNARNLEKRQDAVAVDLTKKNVKKGVTKAALKEEIKDLGRQIEEANNKIAEFRKQAASGMLDDLNPVVADMAKETEVDVDEAGGAVASVEPADAKVVEVSVEEAKTENIPPEEEILDKYLSESERHLLENLREREPSRSVKMQIEALTQYAKKRAERAEATNTVESPKKLDEVEAKMEQDQRDIDILRLEKQIFNASVLANTYQRQLEELGKGHEGESNYIKWSNLLEAQNGRIAKLMEEQRQANNGQEVTDELIAKLKDDSAKIPGTQEFNRTKEKQRASELREKFNKEPKVKNALKNIKRRVLAGLAATIMAATLAGCSLGDLNKPEGENEVIEEILKDFKLNKLDLHEGLQALSDRFKEQAQSKGEDSGEQNEYKQEFKNGFKQDLSDFMSEKKTEGVWAFGENRKDLEGDEEGTKKYYVESLESPLFLISSLSHHPEIMAKCGFEEGTSGEAMLDAMYKSPNGGALQEVAKRELTKVFESKDQYRTRLRFFRGTVGDRFVSNWGRVGEFRDENGNIVKDINDRDGLRAYYEDYSVIEVDGEDVLVEVTTDILDKDGNVIASIVTVNKLNCGGQDMKKTSKNTPLRPYGPDEGTPEKTPDKTPEKTPEKTPDKTPSKPQPNRPSPATPYVPDRPAPVTPQPEKPSPATPVVPPEKPVPPAEENPVVENEKTKDVDNLIENAELGKGENNILDRTPNIDTMTEQERTNVGDGKIDQGNIKGDKTGTYEETTNPTVNMNPNNQQSKVDGAVKDEKLSQTEQEKVGQAVQDAENKADEFEQPGSRPETSDEIEDLYNQLIEGYGGGSTTTTGESTVTETDGGAGTGGSTVTEAGGGAGTDGSVTETSDGGTTGGQSSAPVDLGGGNLGGNLGGAGNSGLGEATSEPGI